MACATPGDGPSIGRRATCSSATSARTSGKRSTSAGQQRRGKLRLAHDGGLALLQSRQRLQRRPLTLPILEYDHTQGCSVTGGFRYRGAEIPALYGTYLYGDLCTGRIWLAVQAGNGSWTSSQSIDSNYTISGWGEDSAGELYLADYNGSVYKLTPTPNSSPDVSGLVPAAVIAGDPAFDLEVDGTGNSVDGSVVRWNGADRP